MIFVLPFCALLQTAILAQWNCDLQVQESRNFLSDARVRSIQDILLLHDNYSPNTPHNPQSNGYRPDEDINPPYTHQYPRSEGIRYRPHQTQGYEIYEEPDLPGSNTQQSTSLQTSNGYSWIPDPTSSKGNVNLQKMKTGLSEPGLSYYPYIFVRSQGDGKIQKIKPSVPSVKLAHQGTPTQFQGNVGVLTNSHVSRGHYLQAMTVIPAQVLERPHIPHGAQPSVNPLAALLLTSSLSQLPLV